MTSINSTQDAARTYIQNAEITRSNAAVAGAPQAPQTQRPHQASKADSVTLSASARLLAAAREAVQAAPDVRADKVADIKQRLGDGTYTVNASVLARKMLKGNS
jgi:negative regulator of flagellin synthesis FlgM